MQRVNILGSNGSIMAFCHNIGTVLPLKRKSEHDIMTMLKTVSRRVTERTIGFNGAFFVCTGSRLHYQGTAFSLQEVLF